MALRASSWCNREPNTLHDIAERAIDGNVPACRKSSICCFRVVGLMFMGVNAMCAHHCPGPQAVGKPLATTGDCCEAARDKVSESGTRYSRSI